MKRIMEAFRAARKIEIVLVLVFLAVLIVIAFGRDTSVTSANTEEARLERLLENIEGSGRLNVLLSGEAGEYRGCVVIAEGADDMRVVLSLQRAIQAATDIPPENIEIISSGG